MARRYTEQELLDYLEGVYDEVGRPLKKTDLDEHDGPSRQTYRRRFGSWNAALRAAGLPVGRERNIPREELLAAIESVAETLGRPPTKTEAVELGRYSTGPYERVWDSWSDALREAGYDPSDWTGHSGSNVAYLSGNGPAPLSKLPNSTVSQADRMAGVTTFNPHPGRTFKKPTPVYYLFEEHQPEEVVTVFYRVNPELGHQRFRDSMIRSVGSRWQPAIKNAVDW